MHFSCQKAKKDDAERIQRHLRQFSVVYFVALMLTTVLNAEFALVFAEQIAFTL